MAKYFLSSKAVDDLSAIWDYTFEVWSESQADKYYTLLIDTCKEIAKAPEIGKFYDGIGNDVFGFRVGRHIVFYRISSPKEVIILRILHQRMDLKNRIDD